MSETAPETVADLPASEFVHVRTRDGLGRLTLDRPRALNAIDIDMVRTLDAALTSWQNAHDVDIVLIDSASERGLCAGGDVRGLRDAIMAGHPQTADEFFRAEYTLNARIGEYAKPIVAIADGITMGGGVGLAGHAAVRVVTERSQVAMPETRIGFTPDVGGSWLLSRAPGRVGEYLALTGATMDAADAIAAGFADHLVPVAHLSALQEALETRADPGRPSELVLLFDETPGASKLMAEREWIDEAFSGDTVAEIVDRLRRRPEPRAGETAALLASLAPTALTITLEAVRRARHLPTLREALAQEYGLVTWFMRTQPDVAEGIRAQLVDKDRSPSWRPATLEEVPADIVREAFSFQPDTALWT